MKGALRPGCILAGVGSALVGILIATLILEPGDPIGSLLLDYQSPERQFFPYPLTIQNLMHVLWLAGMGDLLFRVFDQRREVRARGRSNLPTDDRTVLIPSDLEQLRKAMIPERDSSFLGRAVDQCCLHFQANLSAADAHQILSSLLSLELNRMEIRYTLIRYVAWLLPTVGFIGTVAGISLALHTAGASFESIDMNVVSGQLSVAFFTTLVALLQSAVLVFGYEMVRAREVEGLNDNAQHCLENLINRLYVPESG